MLMMSACVCGVEEADDVRHTGTSHSKLYANIWSSFFHLRAWDWQDKFLEKPTEKPKESLGEKEKSEK